MKWRYAHKLGLLQLVDNGEPGGGTDDPQDPASSDELQEPQEPDGVDDKIDAPWNEDNFDAKRAATLLKNLREENARVKADRDRFKASHDEAENAKLSAQERAEKERDEAKASGSSLALENARLRAILAHGLDEDDLEFIGGATPEEISERAKKYAAKHKSAGGSVTTRPKPRLRGGGDPTEEPVETDPSKLAAQIPRR